MRKLLTPVPGCPGLSFHNFFGTKFQKRYRLAGSLGEWFPEVEHMLLVAKATSKLQPDRLTFASFPVSWIVLLSRPKSASCV